MYFWTVINDIFLYSTISPKKRAVASLRSRTTRACCFAHSGDSVRASGLPHSSPAVPAQMHCQPLTVTSCQPGHCHTQSRSFRPPHPRCVPPSPALLRGQPRREAARLHAAEVFVRWSRCPRGRAHPPDPPRKRRASGMSAPPPSANHTPLSLSP